MNQHPQRLWHPFADMARVPGHELVLVRGEGAWLEDDRGRRYLDATASLWYCNVGYGRAELADAAAAQMRELAAYSTFGAYANRPALELADRLAEIAPVDDAAVFFTTGGSDAVDTAGKIARRYWWLRGEPQRTILVARSEAYHGMNAYGTSLAGIGPNAEGWGPLVTDVVHVPHDDPAALERVLAEHGDRVAAFIGEPVIGAGGVVPPPEGYWEHVQRACAALRRALDRRRGDHRLWPHRTVVRVRALRDRTRPRDDRQGAHVRLPPARRRPVRPARPRRAVGRRRRPVPPRLYVLRARDRLRRRAREPRHHRARGPARSRPRARAGAGRRRSAGLEGAPLVEETRSVGLLGAVQLSAEARAEDPGLADRLVAELQDAGVLVRSLVGHSLQISPPFVISEREVRLLAERGIGGAPRALWRPRQAVAVSTPTEHPARLRRVRERMAPTGHRHPARQRPGEHALPDRLRRLVVLHPAGRGRARRRATSCCSRAQMDAAGARMTTSLDDEQILGFPDDYVQQRDRHPLEWVAARARAARTSSAARSGVEMDAYYFTPARVRRAAKRACPSARFVDAHELVNWVRAIKSPAELELMRTAGRIVERAMAAGIDAVAAGRAPVRRGRGDLRRRRCAAPTGSAATTPRSCRCCRPAPGTGTPHLTWSDEPFSAGEATILELAGCYRRYHCPMARTVFLGRPPRRLADTADGDPSRASRRRWARCGPGVRCEQVEAAWRGEIASARPREVVADRLLGRASATRRTGASTR